MKHIAMILALAAAPSFASPWAGRLDLSATPYAAAYQSFTDSRQALGFEKNVFSLNYSGHEVVRLGVFGGEASGAIGVGPKVVAGPTFALPGSLLDWALNTSWGAAWLPKLKTGVTASYDLVRPSEAHWKPDFIGFGVKYPVGPTP